MFPTPAGSPATAAAPRVTAELTQLRFRTAAGTFIHHHRALATVSTSALGLVSGFALGAALSLGCLLLVRPVCAAWTVVFRFWDRVLGLPGGVAVVPYRWGRAVEFAVPTVRMSAPIPQPVTWWVTAVACAALFAASLYFRTRLPLMYLLRAVAIIQGTAVLYFLLVPRPLPYRLPDYTTAMLTTGLGVMVLVPFLFGLIYNVFDVGVGRKILLAVITVVHLGVFIPHQFLLHAVIVHHASQLFLPTLYLLGGLLLDVVVVVAWYGWAMSWRDRVERAERGTALVPPELSAFRRAAGGAPE